MYLIPYEWCTMYCHHPTGRFPPVRPLPLHRRGVPTSRAIIVHASWLRNYEDINELVLSGLKWILQNVCLPPAGPTAHCKPLHDALLLITDIHSQDKWGVRVGRAVVTVAGAQGWGA